MRSPAGLLWTQDRVGHGARIPTNLALPHPHDVPSVISCQVCGPAIPLGVAAHLVGPELRVGPGPRRLAAVFGAAVPEAAVHEDGGVAGRQDEVRGAALRDLPMEPEPPAGRMDRLAKQDLWSCVDLASPSEVRACLRADPPLRHGSNLRRQYPRFVPQKSTAVRAEIDAIGCLAAP